MSFLNTGGQLHYWRTPSGTEVDFVWSRGGRSVGIEVKASATWRPDHAAALRGLMEQGVLTHAHGVYAGTAERKDGPVRVWPVRAFLRELASGGILA